MVLRPIWIVAFSGQRSRSGLERSTSELLECREFLRCALLDFQQQAKNLGGSIEFISSAAEGTDLLAIEVAESLGLPVHLILPTSVSEFAEDFVHCRGAWDRALTAIAKAGGLVGCDDGAIAALCNLGDRKQPSADWPPHPKAGWTFRVADGSHERDACYHDCGMRMLQAADGLIVVWDQHQEDRLGGTLDVIDQARSQNLPIALIDSTKPQAVSIEWNSKAWAADPMIATMDATVKRAGKKLGISEPIERQFSTLDEVASRTGGRLKNRVTKIIGMQFSATILAAINSAMFIPKTNTSFLSLDIKWEWIWIVSQLLLAIQLLLVVTAFLTGFSSRWTNLKSTWRQTRFGAEVLRSLIHTRHLIDPLFPIISRYDPSWHRFALAGGLTAIRENVRTVDWEVAKANYLRDRMEDQREAYYQKFLAGASKLSSICSRVGFWASTLAPIFLVFAFYLKFAQPPWMATSPWSPLFVSFLPILLPLLAGTSTSLKVITDAGRRAERYAAQADRLSAISTWFPTLKTPYSICRAVESTEEVLLDELIEWYAASKNTAK